MRHKLSLAAVIVTYIAASGCTVNRTDTPAPTGPSTFGTSVSVFATPDLLKLGSAATTPTTPGQSSAITVQVLDERSQPKPFVPLRLEVLVNGVVVEPTCGTFSQRDLVTGSNGLASAVFTAPPGPPFLPQPECAGFKVGDAISIRATPIGTNFQTAISQFANIRLVPFTLTGGPSAFAVNFSMSPSPGKVSPALVNFTDTGSSSPGHTIISYRWDFGDGASKSGSSVTHDYLAPGTYNVTLTVTDDIGQVAFKTAALTITT